MEIFCPFQFTKEEKDSLPCAPLIYIHVITVFFFLMPHGTHWSIVHQSIIFQIWDTLEVDYNIKGYLHICTYMHIYKLYKYHIASHDASHRYVVHIFWLIKIFLILYLSKQEKHSICIYFLNHINICVICAHCFWLVVHPAFALR